jgi:small GTP-binding protein
MNEQIVEDVKVILIGDSGVGKTNLINTSTGGEFNEIEKSSTTASYSKKQMNIDGDLYNLSLWDTIGQEKLRHLSKLFFNNSKIVIFVYDITQKETLEGLNSWYKEVKEILGEEIIKGVVGNKQDLFMKEEVEEEQGEKYAESINAKFRLTSAKEDAQGFINFLELLLKEYINKNGKKPKVNDNIKLVSENHQMKNTKNKRGCC